VSNDNERYPNVAGHRGVDTIIEAAEAITPKIGRLQRLALEAVRNAGARGLTSDETAEALHSDRWSIQPRLSELKLKGLVVDSGLRRRNSTGKNAIVWVTPDNKREIAA
jgi:hypothetical protein